MQAPLIPIRSSKLQPDSGSGSVEDGLADIFYSILGGNGEREAAEELFFLSFPRLDQDGGPGWHL